jgi:hypothetical protein
MCENNAPTTVISTCNITEITVISKHRFGNLKSVRLQIILYLENGVF